MAEWRVRPLGEFPTSFHHAMLEGEGKDKIVGLYMTEGGARDAQNLFRIFRYSIRSYPSSPLYAQEHELYHRTRVDWDDAAKRWAVYLTSKQSALSSLKNPEILE